MKIQRDSCRLAASALLQALPPPKDYIICCPLTIFPPGMHHSHIISHPSSTLLRPKPPHTSSRTPLPNGPHAASVSGALLLFSVLSHCLPVVARPPVMSAGVE
ncbi:hypothetical protein BO99DRAFT_177968 [Aspergillus violaceofuscus CBS 115571]|uniref:Uncharacterized protein n=2 Tax=Aspergillus TaxID=5052 RepID=A0A2V5H7B6_ASPV1|nr:hypothetical protein BO99DRAFT_177968 [Aspergillus violaceofuscus CBS 115571]